MFVTAACLALVMALEPFGRGSRPGDGNQATHSQPDDGVGSEAVGTSERGLDRRANAARLVEFWSNADDLLAADPAVLEALSSVWTDEAGTNGENDSEFAWMLAAVSAELPMPDSDASEQPPALPHPVLPSSREN